MFQAQQAPAPQIAVGIVKEQLEPINEFMESLRGVSIQGKDNNPEHIAAQDALNLLNKFLTNTQHNFEEWNKVHPPHNNYKTRAKLAEKIVARMSKDELVGQIIESKLHTYRSNAAALARDARQYRVEECSHTNNSSSTYKGRTAVALASVAGMETQAMQLALAEQLIQNWTTPMHGGMQFVSDWNAVRQAELGDSSSE